MMGKVAVSIVLGKRLGMLTGAAKKKVSGTMADRFGDYAKDLKTSVEAK